MGRAATGGQEAGKEVGDGAGCRHLLPGHDTDLLRALPLQLQRKGEIGSIEQRGRVKILLSNGAREWNEGRYFECGCSCGWRIAGEIDYPGLL